MTPKSKPRSRERTIRVWADEQGVMLVWVVVCSSRAECRPMMFHQEKRRAEAVARRLTRILSCGPHTVVALTGVWKGGK